MTTTEIPVPVIPNIRGYAIFDVKRQKWHGGGRGVNWGSIPMIFPKISSVKGHITHQITMRSYGGNISVNCFYHDAVIVDLLDMKALEDINPQKCLDASIANARKRRPNVKVISHDPNYKYRESLEPDGTAVP